MIIIRNIIIERDDKNELQKKVDKLLRRKDVKFEIYRKSIDARKNIKFNFQVLVDLDLSEKEIKKIKGADFYEKEDFKPEINNPPKEVDIVGAGPAGLFCAYILSENGVKVNIYERGEKVEDRVNTVNSFMNGQELNPESNIQFGEGGAGTFSDGKLTARSKDKRVRLVLDIFRERGGPEEIMYEQKPHIGTDILKNVIINMRKTIEKNGGQYHFSNRLSNIDIENKKLKSFTVNEKVRESDSLVLALGNSARDSFEMLSEKISMENKQFAVGFRIEHKRKMIDTAQYNGKLESIDGKKLPPASYNLTYNNKEKNMGAYTFCMCPGGYVIDASSEKNRKCVNGMSFHKRDGENSNSALIVTIDERFYGNNLLDGMRFQREIEEKTYKLGEGKIPVQRLEDFISNKESKSFGKIKSSLGRDCKLSNLREIYPEEINEMIIEAVKYMGRKLKGFDDNDAILSGSETRSSSPVKLLRDENNQAENIKNLYFCGEGSGYSGGIVSSAIDGIKTAEKILSRKE